MCSNSRINQKYGFSENIEEAIGGFRETLTIMLDGRRWKFPTFN